jgi:formylglycine-generating enzyme required for sulfatase activity
MRGFACGAVALALSACTLLTDFDALTGGAEPSPEAGADGAADAMADTAAASDAPVDADAGRNDAEAGCKGIHGPKPVSLGSYCIDSTEVTGMSYTEFLAAKAGDMSGQPPACSSNASYEPTVAGNGQVPVFGVDWCDAFAYCAWAGKRLCGKIGGGAVPSALVTNAFADEWYNACSKGGTRDFPYGNTRDGDACNGADRDGSAGPVPVGSLPGCEGGYPGLFDMAGNLWEWEDSCSPDAGGADAGCMVRGSSYASNDSTSCSAARPFPRAFASLSVVTSRCCSDLE